MDTDQIPKMASLVPCAWNPACPSSSPCQAFIDHILLFLLPSFLCVHWSYYLVNISLSLSPHHWTMRSKKVEAMTGLTHYLLSSQHKALHKVLNILFIFFSSSPPIPIPSPPTHHYFYDIWSPKGLLVMPVSWCSHSCVISVAPRLVHVTNRMGNSDIPSVT